jgi:hypothetical protein
MTGQAMFWFTSRDGTRFLVQTPGECALSLALAFPEPGTPVTSRRFMQQVKKECPVGTRSRGGKTAGKAQR